MAKNCSASSMKTSRRGLRRWLRKNLHQKRRAGQKRVRLGNSDFTGGLHAMKNNEIPSSIDPYRSALMARVRQRNSAPERAVRQILRTLRISYGLHRKSLPGTPDITVPSRQSVILVHGCFWHRHPECPKATMPKTRKAFWGDKFERNVARDKRDASALRRLGWKVVTVWECECRQPIKLANRLARLLKAS
jgi:DNA mismatch endonuclease (patch repair protein)